MVTKIERERKWLLKRATDEAWEGDTLHILQIYTEDGWRYRRTRVNGDWVHEKMRKTSLGRGINQEVDIQTITEEEFNKILEQDNVKGVDKLRHVVKTDHHTFEIDDFNSVDMVIVEVENVDMDDTIIFPDWLEKEIIMEVTGNPLFSNANLAIDAKEL